MTEHLPEVRKKPAGGAVDRPIAASRPPRYETRREAFANFLRRLVVHDELDPVLTEWEVAYAATGAFACVAGAGIAGLLPAPEEVDRGTFDILGIVTQDLTFAQGHLTNLVSTLHTLLIPLLVFGAVSLAADSVLAVRLRQPIIWHYFCAAQMLVGFLVGLSMSALVLLLLANIAAGLAAALAVLLFGGVILAVVLGIVAAAGQ